MIAVVGAGMAGLVAAKVLEEAGAEFVLLEAGSVPGGRVRTDTVGGGFRLDRGFQVLLDSCPAVRRHLDLDALGARPFDAGALLWDEGNFFRALNPLRHGEWLLPALLDPVFPASDRLRLASLAASCMAHSDAAILRRCHSPSEESAYELLVRLGFTETTILRFFQPFFGGVFLDDTLSMSAGLFCYYLKKFATGRALLPAQGIGAAAAQLASRLSAGRLRLGTRAAALETGGDRATGLVLESGGFVAADRIILATDEPATLRLLNLSAPPRPAASADTLYFASSRSLYTGALLVLPAGNGRLVRHLAQVTNVAPSLAPAGRHLISATVLHRLDFDDAALAQAVQVDIETIFTEARGSLEFLGIVTVPCAVRSHPPGFAGRPLRLPVPRNVLLAGEQVATGGIQGAMESGEFAAQQALAA